MIRRPRAALGDIFASLRHRNFRLFWTGQLVSVTGNWMNQVAQGWLVLELTDSPVMLGTVGALRWLPVLLLTTFMGAFADRYPKQAILKWTQGLLMALALALGLLTLAGWVRIWHVMLISLLTGVVNSLDNPTRQSFYVELVGKDDLPNAIALNSSVFNGARVIGPAVAGFVIELFGTGPAFILNGVSYLAVLAGLALMRDLPPAAPRPRRRLLEDVGEGLRYIRTTRDVFWAIALLGVVGVFAINWNVVLPVLAKGALEVGAQGLGFLYTALGVGALAGGLALAAARRAPGGVAEVAGYAALFSVLTGAAGAVPSYLLDLVLLALAGYAMIRFTAGCNSFVQSLVPDELRSRVMAVYFLVFGGSTPFGAELLGALAEWFGARWAMVLGSLVALAFSGFVLWLARRPSWVVGPAESPVADGSRGA
ncbi:MAG: MFS transporter [Clostridia bacterium]|nr:MFS transporter [Clostridia bacterium]